MDDVECQYGFRSESRILVRLNCSNYLGKSSLFFGWILLGLWAM